MSKWTNARGVLHQCWLMLWVGLGFGQIAYAISLTAIPWQITEGILSTNVVGVVQDAASGNLPLRFLTGVTEDLLGREPSEAERGISRGVASTLRVRAVAALELVNSVPARTAVVKALHQQYLRRDASASEVTWALRQAGAGVSQDELSVQLLVSAEYLVNRMTATGYANAVYPDLLGRSPTATERTGLQTFLNQGGKLDAYVRALQQTLEYRQRVLDQAAVRFLGHTWTNPWVASSDYLEILTLNLPIEELWAEFLASAEFFARHGEALPQWLNAAASELGTVVARPSSLLLALDPAVGRGGRALSIMQGKEFYFTQLNLNYAMYLGRTPTSTETNAWVNQCGIPFALENLRGLLLGSSEYFGRAGSVYGLAQSLYLGLLGRTPTGAEITELQNFLNSGGLRERYARMLMQTSEYRETYVRELFRKTFVIPPTTNQVTELVGLLAAGQSESQMQAHLFGSFEYAERARTNYLTTNVVKQLYQDLLGRNPLKQAEIDTVPSSSRTREMVVRNVLSTEAYFKALVPSYYQAYLGRVPTTNELAAWRAGFYAGQLPEALQTQLLGSVEFYNRTGGKKDLYLSNLSNVLLGIPADDGLRRLWTNNLVAGGDLTRLVTTVLAANASQKALVNTLAKQHLGRGMDGPELARWLARQKLGWNHHEILTELLASDEYYEKLGGAPDIFTQQLGLDLLGSTNAMLRAQLLADLVRIHPAHGLALQAAGASSEFFLQVTPQFYQTWLGRKATTNELKILTTMWTERASMERVQVTILSSTELYTRWGGTPSGFVNSFIRGVLERASVPADLTAYQKELTDGGTRETYVTKILQGTDRRTIVTKAAYQLLLRRNGTDREIKEAVAGLNEGQRLEQLWACIGAMPEFGANVQDEVVAEFWTRLTGQGMPASLAPAQVALYDVPAARGFLAAGLLAGPEYFRQRVSGFYQQHLKRMASGLELDKAAATQVNEASLLEFESNLLGSVEYYGGVGSTPTAWVNSVYVVLLGRESTETERKAWVPQLTAGLLRSNVARQLIESSEHRRWEIQSVYRELLLREGAPEEVSSGITAGPASTRARTIASPEYFNRLCGDYAVTIQWGDGGESSVVVPVAGNTHPFSAAHLYDNDGTYALTINLTAGGSRCIATNLVTVTNRAPVLSTRLVAFDGVRLVAELQVADTGSNTWTRVVDFGDGAEVQTSATFAQPQFQLARFYDVPGPFKISVTVIDDQGATHLLELSLPNIPPDPKLVPIVGSYFSMDLEGWLTFPRPMSTQNGPRWMKTGGNPDGWLAVSAGSANEPWFWDAPATYLGNKSELNHGLIEFDLKQNSVAPRTHGADLLLIGGDQTLVYMLNTAPGIEWRHYQVLVATNAGWSVETTQKAVTSADLEGVLANLKAFRIRGKFVNEFVETGLDNVRLRGTDPGSVPRLQMRRLFSNGLLGNEYEVLWSSTNRGYQVQMTTNLQSGAWQPVSGAVTVIDGKSQMILSLTNRVPQFFRMAK